MYINVLTEIKNKKLDKYILIYLLLSIISLLTMLLSPGSIKRSKIENVSNIMIGIGILFVMFASGDLNTLQQTIIRLLIGLSNLSIGWVIKMAVISVNKNYPLDKWLNQ